MDIQFLAKWSVVAVLTMWVIISLCSRLFRSDIDQIIVDVCDYSSNRLEVSVVLRNIELQIGILQEVTVIIPKKAFDEMYKNSNFRATVQFYQGFLNSVGARFVGIAPS